MEKIFIKEKNKNFNVSKTILQHIEKLEKEILKVKEEKEILKIRQNNKFKNFSKLVFDEIVDTKKVGVTCKEISFKNGKKVRYHAKNCDNFRFWG